MSDFFSDVLATDAALDLLAARDVTDTEDAVLAGLACLACAVDEHPLPAPLEIVIRPPQQARKCGWALSVTVALTLASSGIAAASADDPLAPFHYLQHQLTWKQPSPPSGWELDGLPPVPSVPSRVKTPPAAVTHQQDATDLAAGAWTPGYGRVRVPAAGRVPGSGSAGHPGAGHAPSGPSTGPEGPTHGGSGHGGSGHGGSGHGGSGHGGSGHGGGRSPVSPRQPVGGHQDPGEWSPTRPIAGSPPRIVSPVQPKRPAAPIQPPTEVGKVSTVEIVVGQRTDYVQTPSIGWQPATTYTITPQLRRDPVQHRHAR